MPINKCNKPKRPPILRNSRNDMGDPSLFERLMARILAGLPMGKIYPPIFTAITRAHHSIGPIIPSACSRAKTGARAAEIGILSTTAEIMPIPNEMKGRENIRGSSRNGVSISPNTTKRPKMSIDPTSINKPIIK